ncbi:hypothetical protein RFI_28023 [Reticulomyxa filosa]|uniref:Uncharacterized protein n=1 Tax=Reticulomyxa filosa TaxID=46433 RepID=X6M602_RETFI|nr:hypothetical protein RFI_28023 [Reticulomyxa filosa]|eukprot:ETO09354.1 hypothetical protein RFI_28023 [Reticulomyxa filosa]
MKILLLIGKILTQTQLKEKKRRAMAVNNLFSRNRIFANTLALKKTENVAPVTNTKHSITTSVAQYINEEIINNLRKDEQFAHAIERRRDWMNYPIFSILFTKFNTFIKLSRFDQEIFKTNTKDFNEFKIRHNLGGKTDRSSWLTRRDNEEMAQDMIESAIKYLKDEKVEYVHLQVKGFSTARNRCLEIVFENLKVMQFADTTSVMWGPGLRRRHAPCLKRVK